LTGHLKKRGLKKNSVSDQVCQSSECFCGEKRGDKLQIREGRGRGIFNSIIADIEDKVGEGEGKGQRTSPELQKIRDGKNPVRRLEGGEIFWPGGKERGDFYEAVSRVG